MLDGQTGGRYQPRLRMVCGQPADAVIEEPFAWYPPALGLLVLFALFPGIIVISLLTKRMTVVIPVCAEHTGHFWKRSLLTWLAVIICFSVPVLVCIGGIGISRDPEMEQLAIMGGLFSFILLLFGTIVVIAAVQNSGIRAKEITDADITLIGVHDDFARELTVIRRRRRLADEDDDFDDLEPRGPFADRDDEFDDQPRRRRGEDWDE